MTTGVSPEAIVAGVGSTGRKLPAAFSFLKNSRPGSTLSADPPLASAAIITPWKPAEAWVGLPFSATLPLNSGFIRSATLVTAGTRPASYPIDIYPPQSFTQTPFGSFNAPGMSPQVATL